MTLFNKIQKMLTLYVIITISEKRTKSTHNSRERAPKTVEIDVAGRSQLVVPIPPRRRPRQQPEHHRVTDYSFNPQRYERPIIVVGLNFL